MIGDACVDDSDVLFMLIFSALLWFSLMLACDVVLCFV